MIFSRSAQGQRRASPSAYKVLLTSHIMVSVGWLGAVFAKLALVCAAVATTAPGTANALYAATGVLNVAFPPLAIATVISGVLLSLGTKWGLLRHYWVATKLVLTVGVISTAIVSGDRLVRQAMAASAGMAAEMGLLDAITSATTLIVSMSVVHLLMLGAATIISVYKPWGRIGTDRSVAMEPQRA